MNEHNSSEEGFLKGRRRGGLARAKALTPERRSQIAKKAAKARWASPGPVRRRPRSDWIRLQIEPEEKRALVAAAKRDGLELSAWLRQIALRAAGLDPTCCPW